METEKRESPPKYIDANALPRHYLPLSALGGRLITYDTDIEAAPAADVAPVVHGHWIKRRESSNHVSYQCSICGHTVHCVEYDVPAKISIPYCICGAKMDEPSGADMRSNKRKED